MANRIPFDYELWKQHPDWEVQGREGDKITHIMDISESGATSLDVTCVVMYVLRGAIGYAGKDGIFHPGRNTVFDLFLVPPAPKREDIYVWQRSDGGMYATRNPDIYMPSPQRFEVVREQQPDGTWKVIGTDQLAAEEADLA